MTTMSGDESLDERAKEDSVGKLFFSLEETTEMSVPPLLKAILVSCGYTDPLTLSGVTEEKNFKSICDYLESDEGKEALEEAIDKSSLSSVDQKYFEKPVKYLNIPGNKARLKGIQEYFLQQKSKPKKSLVQTVDKSKRKSSTVEKSGTHSTNHHEVTPISSDDDKKNLLKYVKNQVSKLKITQSSQKVLENLDVMIYVIAGKKQGKLTCLLCDEAEPSTSTVYPKNRTGWLVYNYIRHINRLHLIKQPITASNMSMDKYVIRGKKSSEDSAENFETGMDPSLDDEEEERRRDLNLNFLS